MNEQDSISSPRNFNFLPKKYSTCEPIQFDCHHRSNLTMTTTKEEEQWQRIGHKADGEERFFGAIYRRVV